MKGGKNTLFQERRKFVRLCVEIVLSKVLFVMLTIRDRLCKVEYGGLYLLCLNCGKFGLYMEGCREISTQVFKEGDGVEEREKNVDFNGIQGGSKVQEGSWSVVSKQRRSIKNKESYLTVVHGGLMDVTVVVITGAKLKGSRFAILGKNILNLKV